MLARKEHDVYDRLGTITAPMIVACGNYGGTAPPANSEAIHVRVPNSELRRCEGGHLFIWQDRSALPELIRFLA